MSLIFDLGNLVRVRVKFTDLDGDSIDPDVVKLSHRDPSGNVSHNTYGVEAITKETTGVYYFDIDADEAGVWYYRWWSTGAGQAAAEQSFTVQAAQAV